MLTHPVTGVIKRQAEWADQLGYTRKAFTSRISRWGCVPRAFDQATETRATPDEVAARRQKIYDIVEEQQPMTVRAVYYQAVVQHIVEKDDNGYHMVDQDLVKMRKGTSPYDGPRVPYEWIVDNTRSITSPFGYDSVSEALLETSINFRVNLWKDADCRVIIFLEKDGLAGVINQITLRCGVDLCPVRGYSSLSFLHEVAEKYCEETRPVHCYLLGDYDPSGMDAHRVIEETITGMVEDMGHEVDFRWKRLGLTEGQIKKWKLPGERATKKTDSRAANWEGGDLSYELDAVEPKKLRKLVKDAIDKHMDDDERTRLRLNEEVKREYIMALAREARD